MRQLFFTTMLAGILAVPAFIVPTVEPASALTKLTHDDKVAIYVRCKKGGGSGKACCAAADGTWEPDGKGGGACTLGGTNLRQLPSGRILLSPNRVMTAP
jgi:hypothetical protein